MRKYAILVVCFLVLTAFLPRTAAQDDSPTLNRIMERGSLRCGINGNVPGFSYMNDNGTLAGLDVDVCRALAAALFGEVTDTNLELVMVSGGERFSALQTGDIDVLVRNTSQTLTRDGDLGINFGPSIMFSGQGLMVQADSGLSGLVDLQDQTVCVMGGSADEQNLMERMATLEIAYEPILMPDVQQLFGAFEAGNCTALTTDQLTMMFMLPPSAVILPDILSVDVLAPAYLEGDARWGDIINWTIYALIASEELGITQANVTSLGNDADARIQQVLGMGENPGGAVLGLPNNFVVNVIAAVGNYGEIYERNLGSLGLARGPNALWRDGGLLYSPLWR